MVTAVEVVGAVEGEGEGVPWAMLFARPEPRRGELERAMERMQSWRVLRRDSGKVLGGAEEMRIRMWITCGGGFFLVSLASLDHCMRRIVDGGDCY